MRTLVYYGFASSDLSSSILEDSFLRSTTPARVDALLLRPGSSRPDHRLVDVVLRFDSSRPALPLVDVVVRRPRRLVWAAQPVETRTLLLSRRIGRALLRLESYCTALPQYPLVPSAFRWSVCIHVYTPRTRNFGHSIDMHLSSPLTPLNMCVRLIAEFPAPY